MDEKSAPLVSHLSKVSTNNLITLNYAGTKPRIFLINVVECTRVARTIEMQTSLFT